MRFTVEGLDNAWPCVGFDEPWIGWATPVVTRDVLEGLAGEVGHTVADHWAGVRVAPSGDPGEGIVLRPDSDGHFHLRDLGWALSEASVGGEFFLDVEPEATWRAVRFGPTWNGWATPVLTLTVLMEMLADLGWEPVDAFGTVTATDPDDDKLIEVFEPDSDGLYDLGDLGLTFSSAAP